MLGCRHHGVSGRPSASRAAASAGQAAGEAAASRGPALSALSCVECTGDAGSRWLELCSSSGHAGPAPELDELALSFRACAACLSAIVVGVGSMRVGVQAGLRSNESLRAVRSGSGRSACMRPRCRIEAAALSWLMRSTRAARGAVVVPVLPELEVGSLIRRRSMILAVGWFSTPRDGDAAWRSPFGQPGSHQLVSVGMAGPWLWLEVGLRQEATGSRCVWSLSARCGCCVVDVLRWPMCSRAVLSWEGWPVDTAGSGEHDGEAPGVAMSTCSHAARSVELEGRSCPEPACGVAVAQLGNTLTLSSTT